MAKQASFAKGELAPSLYARTDLAMYGIGLRTARNGFVAKQGGWYNRPGTTYIGTTKQSPVFPFEYRGVRLVEFIFSDDDAYILEFGEGYIRFYRDGARITVSTADAPAWSSSTSYSIGDLSTYSGTIYYCTVAHSNHVPPNTSYWYPQTLIDGGSPYTSIYQIPNTFTEDELDDFQYTQSNDVIVIVHKNHAPMKLTRSSHTDWTLQNITFTPSISPVTGFTRTIYASPGLTTSIVTWTIVAVSSSGEESLVATRDSFSSGYNYYSFNSSTYVVLSWNTVSDAVAYKI